MKFEGRTLLRSRTLIVKIPKEVIAELELNRGSLISVDIAKLEE